LPTVEAVARQVLAADLTLLHRAGSGTRRGVQSPIESKLELRHHHQMIDIPNAGRS
jgi:hypothetical protein